MDTSAGDVESFPVVGRVGCAVATVAVKACTPRLAVHMDQEANMNKNARDNRSRQLNPQDATYHSSRGTTPPASGTEQTPPTLPTPPAKEQK